MGNDQPAVRKFMPEGDGFRWAQVAQKPYQETGTHFQDISRQVLFGVETLAETEVRYFELAPAGYSALEQHHHPHAVLVLQGQGHVLVADTIYAIAPFDLVQVAPLQWHQFRADDAHPLGFLCLVPCNRDRPVRPTPKALAALRQNPEVAAFIRL